MKENWSGIAVTREIARIHWFFLDFMTLREFLYRENRTYIVLTRQVLSMNRSATAKTFHITTFGCQMNLSDSSTLASVLLTRGYRRVDKEDEADLIIFNTCSVRVKAEDRAMGRLNEIQRLKRIKPDMKVAVVGCMAQRMGEELTEKLPHVDLVLGVDRVFELPDLLEGQEQARQVHTAFGHENIEAITPVTETPYTGFVTISRGCDNFCAYCIVPHVRGREHSLSPKFVIDSVQALVNQGAKEVTLLGQNVNSYVFDGLGFPGLLERVLDETDIPRLRFMTSHPKDLSNQLVDVMADNPRMMTHIHLPLQSGNDRVLEKMGRRYTVDHYLSIIEYVRKKLDYVSITTDLIVGFPSETEPEYEETLAVVRQVGYDAAFMFRYSVRPGTAAAKMEDDVSEDDKIRRLSRLIELQKEISVERNQREVDQVRMSLVEGKSRRSDNIWRARTEGDKTVLFESDNVSPGEVVPIRIAEADAFTLHGKLNREN